MKISVVMATRNNENQIPVALESLLKQTLKPAEILIVNDGSTDSTGKILDDYKIKNPSIMVFHKENQGLTKALAFAFKISTGDLIARMDADDSCHPERLRFQASKFAKNPRLAFCGTWANLVDPEVGTLYTNCARDDDKQLRKYLKSGLNPFVHGSIMVDHKAYHSPGNQYEWDGPAQDFDLWLRLSGAGEIGIVEQFLYTYNYSPDGISITKQKQQREAVKRILTKSKKYGYQKDHQVAKNSDHSDVSKAAVDQNNAMAKTYISYQRAIHAILCNRRVEALTALKNASKGDGIFARRSRTLIGLPLALTIFQIVVRWRFKRGVGQFLKPIDIHWKSDK